MCSLSSTRFSVVLARLHCDSPASVLLSSEFLAGGVSATHTAVVPVRFSLDMRAHLRTSHSPAIRRSCDSRSFSRPLAGTPWRTPFLEDAENDHQQTARRGPPVTRLPSGGVRLPSCVLPCDAVSSCGCSPVSCSAGFTSDCRVFLLEHMRQRYRLSSSVSVVSSGMVTPRVLSADWDRAVERRI